MQGKKKKNQETERSPALTEAQWVIMKVVWEKEPCTAGEVQEILAQSRDWAYSTVKTTMDRMARKDFLKVTRIRNLQLFSSKISKLQATKRAFRKTLKTAFDGALTPLMQYVIEHEDLSEEELKQLRRLVEKPPVKKRKGRGKQ